MVAIVPEFFRRLERWLGSEYGSPMKSSSLWRLRAPDRGRCRVSNRERHASPVDRCGYLPREIFFGRFGFAGGFFSVWATDFGRFFPAT